ncbi:MAG: methyl-accepting chemotaxis protein [Saccharospirillum sp.]
MSRFTVSKKLLLLVLFPLVALAGVLIASYSSSLHKDRLFLTLYNDHLTVLSDVLQTQRLLQTSGMQHLTRYKTGWASQANTRTEMDVLLNQAEQLWSSFDAKRPAPRTETAQAEAEVLAGAFDAAIEQYRRWLEPVGSDALAFRILNESTITAEFERNVQPLIQAIDTFVDQQIEAGNLVRQQAETLTGQLALGYLLGGLGLCAALALMGWLTARSITRPVNRLRDVLMQVATESDLTRRADDRRQDEVGAAAQALNTMLTHFSGLIQNISDTAEQLQEQSGSAGRIGQQVSQGVERQGQQATSLASAAEQLMAAIEQVAGHTREAENLAIETQEGSQEGRGLSHQSMVAVEDLEQQLHTTQSIIQDVFNASQDIAQVVSAIKGISDQTNLLALNAAIESARAGEAGRGFAVVAGEVRTLSFNTQKAIDTIENTILTLQDRAGHAIEAMNRAYKQAVLSVEHTRQADQLFEAISTKMTGIVALNTQMSEASQEQLAVTRHLTSAADRLHQDIDDLAQASEAASDAGQSLSRLAGQLNQDCGRFSTVQSA